MSSPATAQEVQNALEKCKGAIMGNMITRNDIQSVVTGMRAGILQDLYSLHAENKVSIRQAVNHRDQITQRISGLEHAFGRIEQALSILLTQQSRNNDRIQNMNSANNAYTFQRI